MWNWWNHIGAKTLTNSCLNFDTLKKAKVMKPLQFHPQFQKIFPKHSNKTCCQFQLYIQILWNWRGIDFKKSMTPLWNTLSEFLIPKKCRHFYPSSYWVAPYLLRIFQILPKTSVKFKCLVEKVSRQKGATKRVICPKKHRMLKRYFNTFIHFSRSLFRTIFGNKILLL